MQICLLKPGDITTVNRIEFHFFSNRPALVSWFAMASNEQSNCIELSFASTRLEQQWDRLWVIYYHSLVDFAALSKQTKSFCSSVETVATSVGVRSGLGCMSIYHIAAARRCGSSRLIAVVLWLASGFSVRYKLPACNTAMHAMQNECRNSQLITNYTVSKNVPPLVWISFRVQLPISIIFGNSESKKKIKRFFIFRPHHCLVYLGENGNTKIASFYSNAVLLHCKTNQSLLDFFNLVDLQLKLWFHDKIKLF